MAERKGTDKRGFASMEESRRREIAAKGGAAVSKNRDHMSSIGRRGGEVVSGDREHMAAIGRKGGEARGQNLQSTADADKSARKPRKRPKVD